MNKQDAIKKIKEEIIKHKPYVTGGDTESVKVLSYIQGLQTALSILKGGNND